MQRLPRPCLRPKQWKPRPRSRSLHEPAAPEPRIEVQPAGEAVDVMVGAERLADLGGVLVVDLQLDRLLVTAV